MNNTRFATALHILTLLANDEENWLSSEWMAESININPVIVRKEIGVLIKAGLVESRKGKSGGTRLAKNSAAITFSDIYLAIKNSEVLGKKNTKPNPRCPIGRDINQKMDELITEIDQSVVKELSSKTLKSFVEAFH